MIDYANGGSHQVCCNAPHVWCSERLAIIVVATNTPCVVGGSFEEEKGKSVHSTFFRSN